ncbi:MAG: L-dopachrome tautomerase-related protein [Gammaproteobacteria bacterium]|nr:L-dopachrome tautomerase-related protein [Gammaproteobacteria bacterium]
MNIGKSLVSGLACGLLCAGCATQPDPEPRLEVVAELSQGPGNIAVTPDGRVIISQHPLYRPELRVIELLPDGSVRPFPNAAWAAERNDEDIGLDGVLGIQAGADGIVWMLDNGRKSSRLVAWDTREDELHRIIEVGAPARARGSFFNDIAIDPVHRTIYISDASARNPALVVVDLESGAARRVLDRHPSVMAEPIAMVIGGNTYGVDKDGQPRGQIGVDGITIDPASEWVYYGASQSEDLWRVRAADLADDSLTDAELAARIERYGDRPVCDGITVDSAGNVYITDLTGDAIGVTDATGAYRVLHRDEMRLRWPDSLAFGPDNYVYVVSNQLHLSAPFNRGKNLAEPPFYVLRFKALAPGAVGR